MFTLERRIIAVRGELTLQAFAERLSEFGYKFDKGKLSKYERGAVKPATDYYTAVAKIGININWLLTGEGEMYIKQCNEDKKLKSEIERLKSELKNVIKDKDKIDVQTCGGDEQLKSEIERLKSELENAKKMVGIEAIKYINTTLLKTKKRKKK